jgi:uncharacterized protein (TIGR02594 family)
MSFAFKRSVFALLTLVSLLFITPASARPHHSFYSDDARAVSSKHVHLAHRKYTHRKYRKFTRYYHGRKFRHARRMAQRHRFTRQHVRYRSARAYRHARRSAEPRVAISRTDIAATHDDSATQNDPTSKTASLATIGMSFVNEVNKGLVNEARRFIGTNPTDRRSLWCARFMNFVLKRTGRKGTGSDMARSFASYGHRVGGPQVGAIAVLSRGKRGGHVGVVSGVDKGGNPIIISGNHGRRVAESKYPRKRVIAYVMP